MQQTQSPYQIAMFQMDHCDLFHVSNNLDKAEKTSWEAAHGAN